MEQEYPGYNIILRGIFEPSMFHPSWLFHQEIEDANYEQSIQVNNITDEYASFKINMTQYHINKELFQISSENVGIIDFFNSKLTKLFCKIFPHIQVNNVSILKYLHVNLQNNKNWNKLKEKVSPLSVSKKFEKIFGPSDKAYQHEFFNMQFSAKEDMKGCNFIKYITIGKSNLFHDSFGVYLSEEFQYYVENYQSVSKLIEISKRDLENRMEEAEVTFQGIKELI